MTTTRSIFQKICPACMVTLALDARECGCGHQFDHDDNDASLSSEGIRLQAEELYENYLAARAEQASSAVMTAQSEFARDPASAQKSQHVANLIQEAEAARAALTAQSARVAEMRRALPPTPAPAPRPIHAPEPPKKKVVEMKKALPPAPVPASRPVHAPAASKKKVAVAKPAVTPSLVRAKAKVVNSASTDTDNAITTSLLTRRAAKKAASVSTKPGPAPAPVAAKPKTTPPPVQTRTPNPAFRQAQSARAEKILRQAETAAAVKAVIKEETSVVPKIAAAAMIEAKAPPPAAQVLTKSAPRLLGGDKKECPNCTASVDNKINRCRCGFEFPTSETLMPALSMSEEERAEFAKLFNFP